MRELEFGRDRLPFRPVNDRDPLTDPSILRAVRSAIRRGVAHYDLTKWLRQHRPYLTSMYEFDPADLSQYGLEYVWTVTLAYMLACEAAVTDTVDFHAPYLPYALVDEPDGLKTEDLFVLHTAAYAHALLYPVNPDLRRRMAVGLLTDGLMLYATERLSKRYKVAENATPSLLTTRMLTEAALTANTNLMRWGLNVMSVSTSYVVVPPPARGSGTKRTPPKRKKRPKR